MPSTPEEDGKRPRVHAWLTGYFALVVLVTLATHLGNRSPYTYGWSVVPDRGTEVAGRLDGYSFNPDFWRNVPVTDFFYQPSIGNFEQSPNVHLPIPDFLESVAIGLCRSFMLAHYVTNFVLAVLAMHAFGAIGLRAGIAPASLAAAGTFVLLLPYFAHYLGQPTQYIVGPAVGALALAGVLAAEMRRERGSEPVQAWQLGLVCGFLALDYDPYTLLAALVLYVVLASGRKARDAAVFLAAAAVPPIVWAAVSHGVGVPNDPHSEVIGHWSAFVTGPLDAWADVLRHPLVHAMTPWVAFHVGWDVALLEVAASFYWFLLVALGCALFAYRPRPWGDGPSRLVVLVVVCFFAIQFATAAFSWEESPRRAISLLGPFAYVAAWAVSQAWDHKAARLGMAGLAALAFVHSFADVLFHNPAIALTQISQAIEHGPKYIVPFDSVRLESGALPGFAQDGPHPLFAYPRATIGLFCLPAFVRTQGVLFAFVGAFFFWLGRGGVLPRRSAEVWAAVYVTSLVTRVL